MADVSVVTTKDYPGCPKGAVLVKDGDNYVDASTGFWASASLVEKDPDSFRVDVATDSKFFRVNIDGTVEAVTAAGEKDVSPNWFRTEDRANEVALKVLELLKTEKGQ